MSFSRSTCRRPAARPLALLATLCLLAVPAAHAQPGAPTEPSATDPPAAVLPPQQAAPGEMPVNPFRTAPQPGVLEGVTQPATGPNGPTADTSPALPAPQGDSLAEDFGQLLQQPGDSNFSPPLDRTFAMIGDFSGRAGSTVTVGELIGVAVHHPIGSPSAFAMNDLHLITLQTGGGSAIFVGGPAGLLPGSFLSPSVAPPVPSMVPNLTLNNTAGSYTAVKTAATTDVYDDINDPPTLPNATIYDVFESIKFVLPGLNVADIIGRARIQDNNSPLPRDRVFLDYSFFHNVPLSSTGTNVNRFVPGFEKTFWGGMASLEVRVPMAATLATDLVAGRPPESAHPEFGDMMLAPKFLLTSNENFALATGIGITLPTGSNITVANSTGDTLLSVDTASVHLVPYLALLHAPSESSFYVLTFVTLDVDTNGNPINARVDGNGLQEIGIWNDQTLLAVSTSLGQYLYENNGRSSQLKSLAYSLELHGTASVSDADRVSSGGFIIGDAAADLALLNATIGGHARFRNSTATVGYSVPLTSSDRLFDGEFRCFLNRFF